MRRTIAPIAFLALAAGGSTYLASYLYLWNLEDSLSDLRIAVEKADASCRSACEASSDFIACYDRCWGGHPEPATPPECPSGNLDPELPEK